MPELPGIYGLEFERRLVAEPGGHLNDTAVLSQIVHAPDICDEGTGYGGYSVANGSKHYVDSHRPETEHIDHGNNAAYESATPETRSLRELRRYSRGINLQATAAVQAYLQGHPEITAVQYNHRASLGRGNVYGTHLNYGIGHDAAWDLGYKAKYQGEYFVESVANGALLTGGGRLHRNGISLSQKTQGLCFVKGRQGNTGTIYQLPESYEERSALQRVELRLADSLPGDWGSYVQAGLGAIALTVAQLPQQELAKRIGVPTAGEAILRQAKAQNGIKLDQEGVLRAPRSLHAAADWTLRVADAFLGLPRQGVPGEEDLVLAAREISSGSHAFKQALRRGITIHELAAQDIGWAKRAAHALAHTDQRGIIDFSHPECTMADAEYDLVHITADSVTYGPAFAPDTIPAAWKLTEQEVATAVHMPQ